MFPQSSIKRLRFAFIAMAGLTLLALIVGCFTFMFSYRAQEQFAEKATPLLIDIEQLSKVAISFSSTSRQLETIGTQARMDRALARYRSQSDRLQKGLLDLAQHDSERQRVQELKKVVHALEAHEETYAKILSGKIETTTKLASLRREVSEEGRVLLDRLDPFALESSLRMIDITQGQHDQKEPELHLLGETLNEIQLLTAISFATEKFLFASAKGHAGDRADATLREELAPEFRRLTQLVLKLPDQNKRKSIATLLRHLNQKTLASDGITDQSQRLGDAIRQLDKLNQQRTVLLAQMTGLIDKIVANARDRFLSDAKAAQRRSLIAVSALTLLSTIAIAAVIWIGWRLINKDIAERLDRLATSTVSLAGGNLDVVIDQTGCDELADMARAAEIFRRNARELRRAEAELADRLIEVEGANEKLVVANAALDRANAGLAESDLRYELAIKGSAVGIWDWDAQTNQLFWSDRLKEIVGLNDDRFRPEFSSFTDRLHPEDREMVIEGRRQHLEEGQDYDVECRLRHEDGHYVWIHNRGQAVWDDSDRPLRMAGSADDITDRKLAALKLARYAKELERSNQALDDFAYIASHDLKEPLRAVYNHASFLLEDYQGKLDDEGENRLNRMIKLSKRMEQLIADLLYFSRLGRGDQAMEVVDLDKVVAGIDVGLSEMLTARNARIVVPEHLPSISGHSPHITTLLQKLFINGTIYNDSEEKVVEIGLASPAQNKDSPSHETLYVRDNGIGIEKRFQGEIFRIFKRLNSEKAYGEGTGAGRTFVKKIVENHGGQIWLESEPDKGTTFFFTLRKAAAWQTSAPQALVSQS